MHIKLNTDAKLLSGAEVYSRNSPVRRRKNKSQTRLLEGKGPEISKG